MSRCRSCDAVILWAETEKGRRIPVDPTPVQDGNMELIPRDRFHAPLAIVHGVRVPGKEYFKSHFATCPNAAKHRKNR